MMMPKVSSTMPPPKKQVNCDSKEDSKHGKGSLPDFVCGGGAAMINIISTFPINKVMFRQQLHGIRSIHAIAQIRKEGIFNVYRGLMPPLLQKTTSMAIMFGMYSKYQLILQSSFPALNEKVTKGIAAMLAGTTEALLTPFERVQVLMQDPHRHAHFRNTPHAFVELRTYGIAEYFRGFSAILLRNGPSNVMFFLTREEIKKLFPKAQTPGGEIVQDFVGGGVLGAFLSTLFFPVNVIKARMQAKLGGEFMSFRETMWVVYEERGASLKKVMRGVHLNYMRSLLSWGIINASYELLKKNFFS